MTNTEKLRELMIYGFSEISYYVPEDRIIVTDDQERIYLRYFPKKPGAGDIGFHIRKKKDKYKECVITEFEVQDNNDQDRVSICNTITAIATDQGCSRVYVLPSIDEREFYESQGFHAMKDPSMEKPL